MSPTSSLAASLFAILLSSASGVVIVNPGFEDTLLPNPSPGQNDNFFAAFGEGASITPVPGWTFSGTQLDSFTSYGGISDLAPGNHTSDGLIDNNIAWLFINEGRRLATMRATQTLTETLQPNTRYTLTLRVAQAARAEGNPALDNPQFPTLGDGVTTGDVFARLYAGAPGTAMPGFVAGMSTVSAPADHEWVAWTLVWQTSASEALTGSALGIELFNRADTQALTVPVEVFFDDLTLTATAVPEPGTGFMGLATLFGCGLLRLRRGAR